ncbi:MAG: 16S rRNA (guanine(527)-N(7))-methyltransferase RsmG [Polyangiales bacterium]
MDPQRRYLELLLEANQAFNLTAITDPAEAWTKHIEDSLSLLPELTGVTGKVVDIGSGGGLPAIPLAIARPDLKFTLVESTAKKARFLADTARALSLSNVRVESERAESLGQGPLRASFDVATSRACARLPVLLELCIPLLKVGGRKLAIKGEQAALELDEATRALQLLHAKLVSSRRTETGTVLRIDKHAETARKYPRRAGEPKRTPL